MTFNADLEMARLVRGLEEQGFVVELFSPEQTQGLCLCTFLFYYL